jgi:hypothetical protein
METHPGATGLILELWKLTLELWRHTVKLWKLTLGLQGQYCRPGAARNQSFWPEPEFEVSAPAPGQTEMYMLSFHLKRIKQVTPIGIFSKKIS